MPGDHLDLISEPVSSAPSRPAPANQRRFVGVHFACCDIYSRIYVNREDTAYAGRCPRCGRQIVMKIGPGGTESRFFTAY